MSRAIFAAPSTLPRSYLMGEIVSDTSKHLPLFFIRTVSKCSIRSPRAIVGKDAPRVFVQLRRNDAKNGPTNRRIPEHPFRTPIAAGHNTVQILADDGVVESFDDRGQTATCF